MVFMIPLIRAIQLDTSVSGCKKEITAMISPEDSTEKQRVKVIARTNRSPVGRSFSLGLTPHGNGERTSIR